MDFLELIGLRRKAAPPTPSAITLQHLSALGCVWAMNGEPYDCCEVWWDKDADLIHMRMCDQRAPSEFRPGISGHRSYSSEGTKPDWSEKTVIFTPEVLEWPVDRLTRLINISFSPPLALVKG